jgi:hypothetical protein
MASARWAHVRAEREQVGAGTGGGHWTVRSGPQAEEMKLHALRAAARERREDVPSCYKGAASGAAPAHWTPRYTAGGGVGGGGRAQSPRDDDRRDAVALVAELERENDGLRAAHESLLSETDALAQRAAELEAAIHRIGEVCLRRLEVCMCDLRV